MEDLRDAAEIALDWLKHVQHLGGLVDQKTLAADIEKLEAALGGDCSVCATIGNS